MKEPRPSNSYRCNGYGNRLEEYKGRWSIGSTEDKQLRGRPKTRNNSRYLPHDGGKRYVAPRPRRVNSDMMKMAIVNAFRIAFGSFTGGSRGK